jgi:hypothetical protein
MCAPRVTWHTWMRCSSSCHIRVNMGASICITAAGSFSSEDYRWTHVDEYVARTWVSYQCVLCHPWCTHRTSLVVKKNFFQFSCGCEQFRFLVINVFNHGEHYETPLTISYTESRFIAERFKLKWAVCGLRHSVLRNRFIISPSAL